MAGKVLAVMQCGILVGQVKPVRIEEFLAVNDMKIIGRHSVRTSPVAASSDSPKQRGHVRTVAMVWRSSPPSRHPPGFVEPCPPTL